jgi:hypothetical protein
LLFFVQSWLNFCADLLQQAEGDQNVMKLIVMDDETWFYGYDVEIMQNSA